MSSGVYHVERQEQLHANNSGDTSNQPGKKIVYFAVGPNKHEVKCPFCKQDGETLTTQKIDSLDSVNTMFACLCCWCPLSIISCLAYAIPCFIIRQHYCSSCGEYLGTYRRPKL